MLLLVDDDEDDIFFFRDVVTRSFPQLQFNACHNGEEALHYLKTAPVLPNWVFLDLNMPRMNGIQLLKALQQEPMPGLPLIIYTTSHLEKDRELTRELGAHHYIVKPEKFADLEKEIRQVVEKDWR